MFYVLFAAVCQGASTGAAEESTANPSTANPDLTTADGKRFFCVMYITIVGV